MGFVLEKQPPQSLSGVWCAMSASRTIEPILSKTINSLKIIKDKIEGTEI